MQALCIIETWATFLLYSPRFPRRNGYGWVRRTSRQIRRNGYAVAANAAPHRFRRNGYAAETGTRVRFEGLIQRPRRNGYGFGAGSAETGTLGRQRRRPRAGRRTNFCGDNRVLAQISTGIGRAIAGKPRIPGQGTQKRVRFHPSPLWTSLWDGPVIPAETSTRQAQIRVRPAADTGSPLRRIEYVRPQIRVRGGCFFPYESRR